MTAVPYIALMLVIVAGAVVFAWGNDSSNNYRAEKKRREQAEAERDAARTCRDAALALSSKDTYRRMMAEAYAETLARQLGHMVLAADNVEHVEADPAGELPRVVPIERYRT